MFMLVKIRKKSLIKLTKVLYIDQVKLSTVIKAITKYLKSLKGVHDILSENAIK